MGKIEANAPGILAFLTAATQVFLKDGEGGGWGGDRLIQTGRALHQWNNT